MSILERLLPTVGQRLADRYELVSELGRGGFGVVFEAVQIGLNQPVAIKALLPHVLDNAEIVSRFRREVEVAKSLRHPNSIRVLDVNETDEGLPFYVMELVAGLPLDDLLRKQGPLSPARVQRVMLQTMKSLAEAHAKGVVHRDLKPGNLMLCDIHGERDFVKVLDFGIAKALDDSTGLNTSTGMVLGTPAYMSPEQAVGVRDLDGRADLYSAGLILAECLCGSPIVTGATPYVIVAIHSMPSPLEFPASVRSSPFWPIIQRATEKDRQYRYSTAEEMAHAIRGLAGLSDQVDVGLAATLPPSAPPPSVNGLTPAPGQPISGQQRAEVVSGQAYNSGARTMRQQSNVPTKGSSAGLVVGLLVAFAVLIAVAVLFVRGGRDGDTDSPAVTASTPTDPADQASVAGQTDDVFVVVQTNPADDAGQSPTPADPTAAAALAVSAERVAAALPTVRAVSFTGMSSVRVSWNDQLLGVTPFDALLPRSNQALELTYERRGYQSKTESVALASEEVDVQLRRRRRRDDSSNSTPAVEDPPENTSPFGQTGIHE